MIGHAAFLHNWESLCYFGTDALCVIWRGGMERKRMAQNTARRRADGQMNVAHWFRSNSCFKGI